MTALGWENEMTQWNGEKISNVYFYTDDEKKIREIKIELDNGRWIYIFPSYRDAKRLALKIE